MEKTTVDGGRLKAELESIAHVIINGTKLCSVPSFSEVRHGMGVRDMSYAGRRSTEDLQGRATSGQILRRMHGTKTFARRRNGGIRKYLCAVVHLYVLLAVFDEYEQAVLYRDIKTVSSN